MLSGANNIINDNPEETPRRMLTIINVAIMDIKLVYILFLTPKTTKGSGIISINKGRK